jgi:hypothetical protein
MPAVKYDLSGVDDLPDEPHAPVGAYIGVIEEAEAKTSGNGNPMIEVRWRLTHAADGTKLKETYQPIWDYPILEHDSKFVMGKTKAFFEAMGLKLKGSLDTAKLKGKKAQLKLKSDTDDGGDYRPRIGKILPVSDAAAGAADEPEPDEPEAGEGEAIDLDALDRDGLKKLIRSEKLGTLADLGINSKTTDDQIREIIANAMGGGEPEPEEEPEPEPEEEEGEAIDLSELDRDGLKKLIKEEGLGTLAELGINKTTTDDQIRSIIAEKMGGEPEPEEEPEEEPEAEAEPDGEGDGYDAMTIKDLAADFKERSLDEAPLKGLKGAKLKAKVIELLREDDNSSPF